MIPINTTSGKPYLMKNFPFKLQMQKQWMWPKFIKRPNITTMMNKFFICFNYIKNKVINNKPMPIYKTSCNVYPLILQNPLTKPQNNTNRQWQQIEFLINNILYIWFLDGLVKTNYWRSESCFIISNLHTIIPSICKDIKKKYMCFIEFHYTLLSSYFIVFLIPCIND